MPKMSLGCTHLSKNGYNPNSTVLYLEHLSTVRNNLFLNYYKKKKKNNMIVVGVICYCNNNVHGEFNTKDSSEWTPVPIPPS